MLVIGVLAVAGLTGCGVIKDPTGAPPAIALPSQDQSSTSTSTSTSTPAPTPAPGRAIALAVNPTALGQTLTVDGRTVYRFESDGNKPPRSACVGKCVVSWPPLLTDGTAVRVDPSIDSKAVGVLARADGSVQVTLNGWPLYLYAQDKQPGDVKGEGVAGTWSAIDGTAKPLRKK